MRGEGVGGAEQLEYICIIFLQNVVDCYVAWVGSGDGGGSNKEGVEHQNI